MGKEIVGREDEVAALEAFLAGAGGGTAAFVLDGDPGIGKSTLWLAGIEASQERSLRVLSARPAEAEQDLAYAALGDLLGSSAAEVLLEIPTPQRRALQTALLLEGGDGRPADPRALAVAVHSVLAALAERGSLVVALDDVQWLDASSAAALSFAFRRLDREHVTVLLARRAEAETTAVEEAFGDRLERLHIGPLSLGAIQRLVRDRLGLTLPRPTMLRLHEISAGNPFYALELARALAAAGLPLDPAVPLPVPESLDRLVGARVRSLPEETRAALLVVAVIGSPATELVEAAGISTGELAPAVQAQVLEIANDEVQFVHPLLASAVIAEATEAERRGAHRLVATVITEPVAQARHVAAALEEPDAETARLLDDAAELARARGAPMVAAELGEAAARSTPPDRDDDRRRRVVRAVRDHLAAGSAARGFVLAHDLLAHATPGWQRAEARTLLGELEGRSGASPSAVEHLREALRESAGRPELELLIHEQLAHNTRVAEGLGPAERHARAAVRLGEQLGDDAPTARALAALAIVRYNQGEPESFALAKRAVELAGPSGDARAIHDAATASGHCFFWSGRIDEARRVLSGQLQSAVEQDEPAAAGFLWYLALVEGQAGRLALAREYAERSLDLTLQYAGPDLKDEPGVLAPIARVAAFQGDVELARALSERACTYAENQGGGMATGRFHLSLLGVLDHWAGDPRRALERFEAVDEGMQAAGFSYSVNTYVADQVESLLEVGRLADAGELLDEWESQSRKLGHRWAIPEIARCRALVAANRGDVTAAIAGLEEAVALHEEVGDPFGRSRALLLLGVTRRRARQKRAAREAVEASLAGFEAIGAAGWVRKARAELGRIGGRQREEGLTPAERRVATLVAEGRTNREVAAALFLGERTVETHLSHVYAKLGIRSRTELARTLIS